MDTVRILPRRSIASDFIPSEFVPAGADQYTIRNGQFLHSQRNWRRLTSAEVETLVKNGNTADDWANIYVGDRFDPQQVLNTSFFGFVRIGTVVDAVLEHHDLKLPTGITNCRIVSCDIGDDVALHNVHYLAHYIIGDRSIITNVDEMHVSDHAKFGNGVVKDGEDESVRITLDLVNETGSRSVEPFDGMTTADAYLWARYRDDATLQQQLRRFTQEWVDPRRGYYGTIGSQCVVKNTRIIKDVRTGDHCYIKGANKLKNLTINSAEDEPTQIGEGVELVNGIIGYGCRVFYGCKAVRFIMGNNSNLKYGARLIHSFLGDNSTVSCCELLNNLIFPAHEQHHNNSFLVASLIGGQSNIAAGATIGSNHNSRSNDNEIVAGRGFWPGLSTTLKHSSRFASFVLISKGDYPAELDLPLPFSLLSNNVTTGRLEVVPAFWWTRNMYALARNSWKFAARDKRIRKTQHVQFDVLAPDTIEEIIAARRILEEWVGAISLGDSPRWMPQPGTYPNGIAQGENEPETLRRREEGRRVLLERGSILDEALVEVRGIEKSRRSTAILRLREGWDAYGEMLHRYAVGALIDFVDQTFSDNREVTVKGILKEAFNGDSLPDRVTRWINLGGQLVAEDDVTALRRDIREGTVTSWMDVHARYDQLAARYPRERGIHGVGVWLSLAGTDSDNSSLREFFERGIAIQRLIRNRVYESRSKDYTNPFRIATYLSLEEMNAAIGSIDDNAFITQVTQETEDFEARVKAVLQRIPGT